MSWSTTLDTWIRSTSSQYLSRCDGVFGAFLKQGSFLVPCQLLMTDGYNRGAHLHAWKLLSASLLREDEEIPLGLYKFRKHICKPSGDLQTYAKPVTSLSLDFITHLVLSGGCHFSVTDLLSLTDIKNLGVLELIQATDHDGITTPDISDRLLRGWSEKDDPFPLLRILRIWGDRSVTQASLRWVSCFPSLVLYDVQAYRNDWMKPHEHALEHGWEVVETSTGPNDSLINYLAHLSPSEDGEIRVQDLARTADSDLLALCGDSRCPVRFDPTRQAPPLLAYLTGTDRHGLPSYDPDVALREARACHGVTFEAWAFWLYSIVGQLSDDRDLEARSKRPPHQAVVGPFVLPSKPMACLFLGHSGRGGIASKPAYVSRGLFSTRKYTFTRRAAVARDAKAQPLPKAKDPIARTPKDTNGTLKMRKEKRKRMDDMLKSMNS